MFVFYLIHVFGLSVYAGMPVTEISKLLGLKWKEISPEEKATFEAKANVEKERFQRESAEYKAGTYVHVPKVVTAKARGAASSSSSSSSSGGTSVKMEVMEIKDEEDEVVDDDSQDDAIDENENVSSGEESS